MPPVKRQSLQRALPRAEFPPNSGRRASGTGSGPSAAGQGVGIQAPARLPGCYLPRGARPSAPPGKSDAKRVCAVIPIAGQGRSMPCSHHLPRERSPGQPGTLVTQTTGVKVTQEATALTRTSVPCAESCRSACQFAGVGMACGSDPSLPSLASAAPRGPSPGRDSDSVAPGPSARDVPPPACSAGKCLGRRDLTQPLGRSASRWVCRRRSWPLCGAVKGAAI